MNIIENCDMNIITFLVNGKRGTEIVTENMFEHLLHFATQAVLQIFFSNLLRILFYSKGQLISKCPFAVIVWTKLQTKN